MQDAIFSKTLSASGKTYFFDVKQAKGGKQSKYVQVSETWTKDGQKHRSSLTIFSDKLQDFMGALQETVNQAS